MTLELRMIEIKNLTPQDIVRELDRYIIGQQEAKRAVAIALRNRWRRQQVKGPLRDEIAPKNIIMIGPTGVGKTEIARRLAKLANAPFIKVEATKYTEVGYVGKDVESMIRDLTEVGFKLVKDEETKKIQKKAESIATEKLIDMLMPSYITAHVESSGSIENGTEETRQKLKILFNEGKLDDQFVEFEVSERGMPSIEIFSGAGFESMSFDMREALEGMLPKRKKKKRVKAKEAFQILINEEATKLIDIEKVKKEAISRVEQLGIIFLDEIDKVAGRNGSHGIDVSREGVQRDILPIVEGSNVTTKYGMVKTDHILFIAAGAFTISKPSDLIPELQGRFPIRVELRKLTKDDFVRILTEPDNSLVKQYQALMKTEDIELEITDGAREKISEVAAYVNDRTENIGARRLHTVMEKLLDELSFNASEISEKNITIDPKYVDERLSDLIKDEDLTRYIL